MCQKISFFVNTSFNMRIKLNVCMTWMLNKSIVWFFLKNDQFTEYIIAYVLRLHIITVFKNDTLVFIFYKRIIFCSKLFSKCTKKCIHGYHFLSWFFICLLFLTYFAVWQNILSLVNIFFHHQQVILPHGFGCIIFSI